MNIADVSPILNNLYAAKKSAKALALACTGYTVEPWIKRAGAGHCNAADPITAETYFHMTSGWNYQTQSLPPGHWRTKDWIEVQRAIEPINVLPATFSEMAFFDGQLFRCNGLFDYPFSNSSTTHTTNKVFVSRNGSAPWALDPNAPPQERECGMAVVSGGYLYIGLGENYHVNPPPTYNMALDIWRRDSAGNWTQRNNSMTPRRSFVAFDWQGQLVIGCGRDDTRYTTVVDLNDFIVSGDGGATVQSLGEAPFRGAYSRRPAAFHGGIVLVGGAYSTGNGNTSSTAYLDEVWWTDTPLVPSSYVPLPPLPIACAHAMVGVLVVDGVETLAVIGGYNSNDRPDGSPYGTIFTFTWADGMWRERRDSGFWVDP